MRKVVKNEDRLQSERMANALKSNNHKNLWHEVNKLKGMAKTLPVIVDGVKVDANIADIFAKKYEHLYTSVSSDEGTMSCVTNEIKGKLDELSNDDVNSSLFAVCDIISAVKLLSCGKSDGQTGLFSDHIVHGPHRLYSCLTSLFNAMIIHGMSPKDMLKSVMLPIVKNKKVQRNRSDNFRAVCLQSVLCKLLDLIVLNREEQKLITSELQFGFKSKHSTALATSVLLQTVDYYIDNGGQVYGMALDATKAFDRVEYAKLFQLLLLRDMNPLYIRLILEMYVNQKMCVRYSSSSSKWFSPTNGVKQGGVLSPTLFAVYIDGMLRQLEQCKIGCNVGSKYCGVIGYADDVFLLAPNQAAMHKMIEICETYANEYKIIFNGDKCQTIVFDKGDCQIEPVFYVSNQKVACVKELVYLGYCIKGDRVDPQVKPIVVDFNRKVNALIGDLDCISSEVKGKLFQQYCTSLYGVIFSKLYHSDSNKLNVSWRKAMRRLFKLPLRTHCRLLPTITNMIPIDVLVDIRFCKHLLSGLNHDNSVVRFLFNLCTGLDHSVMARNYRHICWKYDFNQKLFMNSSSNVISKIVKDKYYASVLESDKCIGVQIQELIYFRDSLCEDFHLSHQEICDIIEYLATV